MDRRQAEAEADRLNREQDTADGFEWVALPARAGSWAVVRAPRRTAIDPVTATTRAVPRPAQQEPPNFGPLNDLPGYR